MLTKLPTNDERITRIIKNKIFLKYMYYLIDRFNKAQYNIFHAPYTNHNQRRKEKKKLIDPSFPIAGAPRGSMAALRLFVFTLFLSLLLAGSISDVDDEPGSNGVDDLSSRIRSLGECPPQFPQIIVQFRCSCYL